MPKALGNIFLTINLIYSKYMLYANNRSLLACAMQGGTEIYSPMRNVKVFSETKTHMYFVPIFVLEVLL